MESNHTTPVILIQWGTFGRQKTLQGTLADISAKVLETKFSNPAIILVGEVISLREKISWFEKMPLYGRQILLARTGESVSSLAQELMEKGADVIEFPKWKKIIIPVDVSKVTTYDHILFSSPESVEEFFQAVIEKGIDIRQIKADFFGRSSKSLKALENRGFVARLLAEMPETDSLLIVGDDLILKKEYEKADVLATSRKVLDRQFLPIFQRMIEEADVNTVVFPSRASVGAMIEGLKECSIVAIELLRDMQVVCMGRQTMNAIEASGLPVGGMPETATREALMEYLVQRPFNGDSFGNDHD